MELGRRGGRDGLSNDGSGSDDDHCIVSKSGVVDFRRAGSDAQDGLDSIDPFLTNDRVTCLLLRFNCTALVDALAFTFVPEQNLDGYLGEGTWCPATLAMVRMMANCQLGLVSTFALVALTGDERTLKIMFRMLILITLGAFRGVYLGVMEGTIRPPWETQWASLLSLPPMLFLCYFAFVF